MGLTIAYSPNVVAYVENATTTASPINITLPAPPGASGYGAPRLRVCSIAHTQEQGVQGDFFELCLCTPTDVVWRCGLHGSTATNTPSIPFYINFPPDCRPDIYGATPTLQLIRVTGTGSVGRFSGSVTFQYV